MVSQNHEKLRNFQHCFSELLRANLLTNFWNISRFAFRQREHQALESAATRPTRFADVAVVRRTTSRSRCAHSAVIQLPRPVLVSSSDFMLPNPLSYPIYPFQTTGLWRLREGRPPELDDAVTSRLFAAASATDSAKEHKPSPVRQRFKQSATNKSCTARQLQWKNVKCFGKHQRNNLNKS